MIADAQPPHELAAGTSPRIDKLYARLFAVAAILAVLAYGLAQIPPVVDGATLACRSLRLCSPPPIKPMSDLNSGWYGSGATWGAASTPPLEKYRDENPDYDITFHQGREYQQWGNSFLHTDPQYRFEGSFTGTPKWIGLFDIIGAKLQALSGMLWTPWSWLRSL
jgi:hypothetical protein